MNMDDPDKKEIDFDKSFDVQKLRGQNLLGQKITEARKTAGLSQRDLSAELKKYNLSVGSGSISKWEKGDAVPNAYQLLALCHRLGIEDALSYFTGLSPQSQDYTPQLNQKGLNLLQVFKETLIASGMYSPHSRRFHADHPAAEIMVKVFQIPAAAGSGSFLEDEAYDEIAFDPANVPEDTDFGIRISGDSMLPRYVPGQIVMVEKCESLYPGEIGVFIFNGSAYIKQYRESMPAEDELEDYICDGRVIPKITLYSLNRERSDCDVSVTGNDSLLIVGRVLS